MSFHEANVPKSLVESVAAMLREDVHGDLPDHIRDMHPGRKSATGESMSARAVKYHKAAIDHLSKNADKNARALQWHKEQHAHVSKRLAEENLEEAFFNHRTAGSHGIMHPDSAKHAKVGEYMDFYDHGTGDKKHGKITRNDGKNVHVQHQGKVKKFTIAKTYPGYEAQNESVDQIDEAIAYAMSSSNYNSEKQRAERAAKAGEEAYAKIHSHITNAENHVKAGDHKAAKSEYEKAKSMRNSHAHLLHPQYDKTGHGFVTHRLDKVAKTIHESADADQLDEGSMDKMSLKKLRDHHQYHHETGEGSKRSYQAMGAIERHVEKKYGKKARDKMVNDTDEYAAGGSIHEGSFKDMEIEHQERMEKGKAKWDAEDHRKHAEYQKFLKADAKHAGKKTVKEGESCSCQIDEASYFTDPRYDGAKAAEHAASVAKGDKENSLASGEDFGKYLKKNNKFMSAVSARSRRKTFRNSKGAEVEE